MFSISKKSFVKLGGAALATTLVVGCAANDPNQRAKTGAAIGALAGAVLGHQVNDDNGRYAGAVIGAIAGGAVGNYMDKQQAELEQQLAAEQAADMLNITRMADNALRVGIASDASFAVDSSSISADAHNTFSKIASVLVDYDASVIHIVGHTDSTGTEEHNQGLSERRARSVADLLGGQGVPRDRLRTEGRGEFEPLASNSTSEGRRQNRRVDIVIKPIIQGQEQQAYTRPGYLGR